MNFDDVNIGGQLKIGTGVVPAIKEGDERINGSMYAEGPVVLGGESEFGNQDATLMISRIVNDDKDCKPPKDDKSLFIKGDAGLRLMERMYMEYISRATPALIPMGAQTMPCM